MLTPKVFIGILAVLAIYAVAVNKGRYLNSSDGTHYYQTPELRALTAIDDDEPCCARSCTTPNNNSSCCLKCSDVSEWPTADTLKISEGTYVDSDSGSSSTLQPNENVTPGRVLLYVTTHFSKQHEMYLKYCWPNILARSPLLQAADVAVYLNPSKVENRNEAMDVLKETFADHNLVVYLRENAEYTTGATMAMTEAVTNNYFGGYDWVIRLNPDVIIRDDSYLMEHMVDPAVSALLINCSRRGNKVHTDFFMIRPHLLSLGSFPTTVFRNNAELSFTRSIQESVLNKGSHRWIPGTNPQSSACRAGDGREFHTTPIVHEHTLHPDICSVPEADVESTKAVFPDPWPRRWNIVEPSLE